MSETAELHVKENVEIVRRPSEKLGLHFSESFKGVVKEGRAPDVGRSMHIDRWGRLTADPKQWPDGIAGAVKHLHSLGIKIINRQAGW